MELGKVIGQVVSTVRDAGLPNLTFLLVNIVDEHGNGHVPQPGGGGHDRRRRGRDGPAGAGQLRPAWSWRASPPLDLSVVGIVDQIYSGKEAIYSKYK